MSTIIHDIDLFGRTDKKGNPIVHYDADAVANALSLWLTSKKGDFIREPDLGGVLDRVLFKQMTESKRELLIFHIRNALTMYFDPPINLLALDVEPDYENRLWKITVEFENPFNNVAQEVVIYTKDLSKKLSFEYEEIDYIGENLYNWCRIKQSDLHGKYIKYDSDRLKWIWSKYILNNFTSSDPYFYQIIELINGT